MGKQSEWAAEYLGQACIAYLSLRAAGRDWPMRAPFLAELRRDIVAQAREHADDRAFFDYLVGIATLDNGDNGLDGKGLALVGETLELAELCPRDAIPRDFDGWRRLATALPAKGDESAQARAA